jgi:hypothetical protein
VGSGNAYYSDRDGVLFNKDQTLLIQYPISRAGSYVIPDTVAVIGHAAFYNSRDLTGVIPGSGVTTIRESAFEWCTSLTGIHLPASVTTIEDFAFYHCDGILSFTVSAGNGFFSDRDGVLFDKDQSTLILFPAGRPGNYIIPDSVATIGDYAFFNCDGLSSLDIPDSVTTIGNRAFYDLDGVTRLAIPDSVTSIGERAFNSCSSLATVIIGRNVATIGDQAFWWCYELTRVHFTGDAPDSSALQFYGSNQATVYYLPDTSGWGSTFAGRPTVLWNPHISELLPSPDGNGLAFVVTGTADIPVAVEAAADPLADAWMRLTTTTLTGGMHQFHDAAAADYPTRVYRIAAP